MTAAKVLDDYQDAQDKEQTQYLLIPTAKWEMHHHC